MLEKHAEEEYGLGIFEDDTPHGPMHWFDFEILMRLLLDAFDLTQYAVTGSTAKPVLFAAKGDGAQFTAYLSHFTIGGSFPDPRAKDPLTGIPLCLSDDYQS